MIDSTYLFHVVRLPGECCACSNSSECSNQFSFAWKMMYTSAASRNQIALGSKRSNALLYRDIWHPKQVPPLSVGAWRPIYPCHNPTKETAMTPYAWPDCGCLQRHILDRSRRGKQQCPSRLNAHLLRDCSKRLRCKATYVGGSVHILIRQGLLV